MDVGAIIPGTSALPGAGAPSVGAAGERSFREILQESIERVERLQAQADGTMQKLALGQATEIEALVALQQARGAMDAMSEIRNRITAAFTEIQQMRV